jgi:hypothetical protein
VRTAPALIEYSLPHSHSLEHDLNADITSSYMGSLTTPPCTEGVLWFIGTEPLSLKIETYMALKNTVKTNNRFTQSYLGTTPVEGILETAAKGL